MKDEEFEWRELIDTGSCCNVFHAIHTTTGKEVALKKVFWTNKPSLVLKEAKRVLSFHHPGIVNLLGLYRKGDQAVMVFEYLRFHPFRSIVKQFDCSLTQRYFRALLEPLRYIHSQKVLHRDIKPANFLFDVDTRQGKIIDFGCSEDYIPERGGLRKVRKPHRLGTKGFRAPEVLLGHEHQTTAIDMWSCGVILLSILTGRYPFFKCNDDVEELVQITRVIGTDRIFAIAKRFNRVIDTHGADIGLQRKPLRELCLSLNAALPDRGYPDSVFDLLERMLDPDPDTRITASQALAHPFLQ